MQKIKKGDIVEVIAGKDIGERGEVLAVLPKENRVIVDGINRMKKHQKAQQAGNQQVPAQIIDINAPIHISNVMLVSPSGVRTRVGFKVNEEGRKVRYCKATGEELDN
jgi:large subunit ribosomal protein L24